MANYPNKIIVQQRLNQNAIERAAELIQRTGRALPCYVTAISGSLVTVAFDVKSVPWNLPTLTIPKLESPWVRSPTQVGDRGFTIAADAYLDKASGQSTAIPDLTPPLNLSALCFAPLSNAQNPPSDPNAVLISGPNGALIKTVDGNATVEISQTQIKLTYSVAIEEEDGVPKTAVLDNSITIDASGITITGTPVIINGVDFSTHVHGGVTPGGSNTTGPV